MADWKKYFAGKRVWVTGASSGIGEALVNALGEAGVSTLASARRVDRLEALAANHESVSILPLDLENRADIQEVVARAWDQLSGIDVLINNAGITQRARFVESDPAALERVVDVNLLGTMRLTHAVTARMNHQGSGHLVVITSVVAKIPTPQRTAYAAAKRGLHGLFDAMRGELEPRGISITIAAPGFVKTEVSQHAVTETGEEHGMLDPNQASGHTADACALDILKGVAKRKREFFVSMAPKIWFALFLRTVAPGMLWRILARAEVT